MISIRSLYLYILFLIFHSVNSATIFVSDGSGSDIIGCGTSDTSACKSISFGLNVSSSEDSMTILNGDYSGDLNEGIVISLSSYSMKGEGSLSTKIKCTTSNGFITISKPGGTFSFSDMGIEDCLKSGTINEEEGGSGIFARRANLTFNSITFANNSQPESFGGGILLLGSDATFDDVHFNDNWGLIGGGIAVFENSTLNFSHSTFDSNQGLLVGGGIYSSESKIIFHKNISVKNNYAISSGGGLDLRASIIHIHDSYFESNHAIGDDQCTIELCSGRGGAIYGLGTSGSIKSSTFISNSVISEGDSLSEGGGIMLTSLSTNKMDIDNCTFSSNLAVGKNSAAGSGGSLFIEKLDLTITNCIFLSNQAISTDDFAQMESSGGAIVLNRVTKGTLQNNHFTSNSIEGGGSGGAIQIEDGSVIDFIDCEFYQNSITSSFTTPSMGGAISITSTSQVFFIDSIFANNSALPVVSPSPIQPQTFSGMGGAVYIQSSQAHISYCTFEFNFATSGMFDDGSFGGAICVENSEYTKITNSTFLQNEARGTYSTMVYGTSGVGGAIGLKYSNLVVLSSVFMKNLATAGGWSASAGGALALYFSEMNGYKPLIQNTTFVNNTASGEILGTPIDRTGHGGAIIIIASFPTIRNVTFDSNTAYTSETHRSIALGGAICLYYQASTAVYDSYFYHNSASSGFGADVASGSFDGGSAINGTILLSNCKFDTPSVKRNNILPSTISSYSSLYETTTTRRTSANYEYEEYEEYDDEDGLSEEEYERLYILSNRHLRSTFYDFDQSYLDDHQIQIDMNGDSMLNDISSYSPFQSSSRIEIVSSFRSQEKSSSVSVVEISSSTCSSSNPLEVKKTS